MAMSIEEVHAALTGPGSPFEIEEIPIRGISTRVWKSAPASLRQVLEQSREHADRTFLVYEDDRLSFAEHYLAVARLAHLLARSWGIRKGDRVAIAMRNYPEWSIAF